MACVAPKDFVARPEGTVDVPHRHHDALSQLVLAWLLWLVKWHHTSFLSWLVLLVCSVVVGGG
jgi:hypothetical protein